jgi:hypothetical protein
MGYRVIGAVAVVKLRGGNGDERYLYHGAPVDENAFLKASIQHAIDVGLVEEFEDPDVAPRGRPGPVAPAAPAGQEVTPQEGGG